MNHGILTHISLNAISNTNRSSGCGKDQSVVTGTKRPLTDVEETGDPTTSSSSAASLEGLFRRFGLYLSLPSDEGVTGSSVCLVFYGPCHCVRNMVYY